MWKRIQFSLLFSIFFYAICLNASAADYVYGDADNDKSITASDAAAVLQYTLNGNWADLVPVEYCDVDDDGFITASDAADILQKSLKEDFNFKKSAPVSKKLEIIASGGSIYLTKGENAADTTALIALDGSKEDFLAESGRYKVLIFGDISSRRTASLMKSFILGSLGGYADVSAIFTGETNDIYDVGEFVEDFDTDFASGIKYCTYSETAAKNEQAYRSLMPEANSAMPLTVVIDENNKIKLVAYGSVGVYEAVRAVVTGEDYIFATTAQTTTETTTETTTQTTTETTTEVTTTTQNPFPNIRALLKEGRRLRDENINDEAAYIWLAAADEYNENNIDKANYSYLNSALFYAQKSGTPSQYYNKIIGLLESTRFAVDSEDIPDLIFDGEFYAEEGGTDEGLYAWLGDINSLNEQYKTLDTYDTFNALLFKAISGNAPRDYINKIIDMLKKMQILLSPETTTQTTTEATTEPTSVETTVETTTETTTQAETVSPNKVMEVDGVKFYIGQPEDELLEPSRVEMGIEGCYWYIYNNDYHHYTQIGVYDNVVKCIYTMSEDLKYRDLTYNMDVSGLKLTEDPQYFYYKYGTYDGVDSYLYFDGNDGEKLYGIMLVSADYKLKEVYTDRTIQNAKYEIFDILNAFRARNGAAPLKYDKQLEGVAQAHSDYMSSKHLFSHVGEKGTKIGGRLDDAGIYFNYACENIAIGDIWPTGVTFGWINSSGHRANMLKNLETVGIGMTYTEGNYFIGDDDHRYNAETAYVENFVHVDP